jgi:hypothetical protein
MESSTVVEAGKAGMGVSLWLVFVWRAAYAGRAVRQWTFMARHTFDVVRRYYDGASLHHPVILRCEACDAPRRTKRLEVMNGRDVAGPSPFEGRDKAATSGGRG